MLSYAALSDIPEETRNRMSVSFGSRQLLRAIRGEPLEIPQVHDYVRVRPSVRKPKITQPPKAVTPYASQVIAAVEAAFDLEPGELLIRDRHAGKTHARAIAVRLLRDRMRGAEHVYSTPRIAAMFNRDPSTITHSLSMFSIYCRNERVANIYASLKERLV